MRMINRANHTHIYQLITYLREELCNMSVASEVPRSVLYINILKRVEGARENDDR